MRLRDLRPALRPGRCPICGPTLFLRWRLQEAAARCLRCRGSAVHLSLAHAVAEVFGPVAGRAVCELSTHGAWVRHLRRRAGALALSEFLDGVPSGSEIDGVRCENVEALSYADQSFDLCTSTEVFEHVGDDAAGFRELHRVLRPGGWVVFTVPLYGRERTIERVRRGDNGALAHLLPPDFHGDRLRGPGRVLVWREYGHDILTRLHAAGFVDARYVDATHVVPWGLGRRVIVARRGIEDT